MKNKEYLISSSSLWNQINDDFGNAGGVYLMFYKEDNVVRTINRLLGEDNEGTLYIGKGKSLLKRVTGLKKP